MDKMKTPRGRHALIAVVAAIAIVAAGCTAGSSGGGDKAGGAGEPVVLTMGEGGDDFSTNPPVADFVRRVGELSGGTLRIEVAPEYGGGGPDTEQQTVRDVQAGKVDLGSVGTRVFDTLEVNSFQALTAPMLIDSYPLERAVITSPIPGLMLASLDKIGVVGLGVLGNGLRRPVAVKQPLLGPADWRGITFHATRSEGQADAIRALGARPTDVGGVALDEGLANGQVQGKEDALLGYQVGGRATAAPYVSANVILWPKTTTLLANPDRFARLTAEQRGWLRRAASDAASASTSLFVREDGIVAKVCADGARLTDASETDLAALREAFLPVYATLEQDPATKDFIGRIEQLKRSTPMGPPLAIPAGCTGSLAGGPNTNDPLAGRWTTAKITESQWVRAFVAAGGSEKDGHAGFFIIDDHETTQYVVVALTFQDGAWAEYQGGDGRDPVKGTGGTYKIGDDGTLTLTEAQFSATCSGTFRYDVRGATLRLYVVKPCDYDPTGVTLFASFPFTRSN